jgi:hypothetical protein
VFERTWNSFKNSSKRCRVCAQKIVTMKQSHSYEHVKHIIEVESGSGCILLSDTYVSMTKSLMLQCKCGNILKTTLGNFLKGQQQCKTCGQEIGASKNRLTYEEIKLYIEVESNSGCKLLSDKYIPTQKLKLQCKCGNEFEVTFQKFRCDSQHRCRLCANRQIALSKMYTYEEAKDIVESKNNCKLLSKVYNGYQQKLEIQCECGEIFHRAFCSFLNGASGHCHKCKSSTGEQVINDWLLEHNIQFHTQYKFTNCKNKRTLPFDFYISVYNLTIEYQGRQHYKTVQFGGISKERAESNLITVQTNDNIKRTYCQQNNIKLLEIPYWDFNKIEQILQIELADLIATNNT